MNIQSVIKYCLLIVLLPLVMSCKKEEASPASNEPKGTQLAATFSNETHQIDILTINGKFQTGYNKVFLRIRNSNGSLVNDASISWLPVMNMVGMGHSCPFSTVVAERNNSSVYNGYIIFQMAGNDTEYWDLTLNYTISGISFTMKDRIEVSEAPKRSVESFEGSDGKRYVLAMLEPSAPRVAINDMTAALYRMESMMEFVIVDNYKINIDPRMPGMANHTSPNNVNLTQGAEGLYFGKVSLTMTGYWKVNLVLEDNNGGILKGEEVTETNKSSSIYFELEF